jgi:hypothetical protein
MVKFPAIDHQNMVDMALSDSLEHHKYPFKGEDDGRR